MKMCEIGNCAGIKGIFMAKRLFCFIQDVKLHLLFQESYKCVYATATIFYVLIKISILLEYSLYINSDKGWQKILYL